jgi:hypothetical protein
MSLLCMWGGKGRILVLFVQPIRCRWWLAPSLPFENFNGPNTNKWPTTIETDVSSDQRSPIIRSQTNCVSRSIPGRSMWDLWWKKWHWNRLCPEYFGFPLSVSFHWCFITRKNEKTNHLHRRVALRLRCVRSICCGAFQHKKTVFGESLLDSQPTFVLNVVYVTSHRFLLFSQRSLYLV